MLQITVLDTVEGAEAGASLTVLENQSFRTFYSIFFQHCYITLIPNPIRQMFPMAQQQRLTTFSFENDTLYYN